MAVTTNSQRLRNRLQGFLRTLPTAANAAVIAAAQDSVSRVKAAVQSRWANHNQVGFDLDRFLNIISNIEPIQDGVGIFNVERMGTYDDLEQIRGIPRLWHQGTRNSAAFEAFYRQQGMFFDQVAELADRRNQRWGDTEPQWWLLEHGNLGSGAYAPQPPNPAINSTVIASMPRIYTTVERTVVTILRQRGVIS